MTRPARPARAPRPARTPRPARRAAALSLLIVLLGCGLSLSWQLARAERYERALARAGATATGTVLDHDDGHDDDHDHDGRVRVRWRDLTGREHVDTLDVRRPGRLPPGAALAVRFDPGDRDARAFPPPGEATRPGDLRAAGALAATAGLLPAGAWLVRRSRAARAGTRARRPMSAEPMAGLVTLAGVRVGWQSWVRLRDAYEPGPGARLQRVMWHPELDRLAAGAHVTVHGRLDGGVPVAVELDSGVRLVPLGRTRRRPPPWVLVLPRRDARTHLRDDAWVPPASAPASAPADGPAPRAPRRRGRPLPAVLAGAGASVLPALVVGGASGWPVWLGLGVASGGAAWGLLTDEP